MHEEKKDNKISDIFCKMQNFLRKSRASIIITSPIKLFISGPRHLENSNLFISNYYQKVQLSQNFPISALLQIFLVDSDTVVKCNFQLQNISPQIMETRVKCSNIKEGTMYLVYTAMVCVHFFMYVKIVSLVNYSLI